MPDLTGGPVWVMLSKGRASRYQSLQKVWAYAQGRYHVVRAVVRAAVVLVSMTQALA